MDDRKCVLRLQNKSKALQKLRRSKNSSGMMRQITNGEKGEFAFIGLREHLYS